MLVILIDNKRVLPGTICQSCPMASQSGQPRWQAGQLRCGRPVDTKVGTEIETKLIGKTVQDEYAQREYPQYECTQYECTMGFRIAELVD